MKETNKTERFFVKKKIFFSELKQKNPQKINK
jgi:hypothetical protein